MMRNRLIAWAKRPLRHQPSRRFHAHTCAAVVLAAFFVTPVDAQSGLKPLDDKSIRTIFANTMAHPVGDDGSNMFGNTEWFLGFKGYYRPMHHGEIDGTYRVLGGQVCVTENGNDKPVCRRVYRKGKKIYFSLMRRSRPGVLLEYTFRPFKRD